MGIIVADVLGPWHDVEATDPDTGATYRDRRRLPQFLADVGQMPWCDVTAQAAAIIPPPPGLAAWRVWCTPEQLAALVAHPAYEVLRQAEVERAHQNPDAWPVRAVEAPPTDGAFPPLPESGWLEAGAVYQYGEQAVIVRQSHTRTEHAPEAVPALFMVYRADATSTLEWVAGEQVSVGTLRTYGGQTYRCLQAHVSQLDWTPPATPALWAVVEAEPEPGDTPEWAAGVKYAVGDRVVYNGTEYVCRQGHTSISTWTPPVVPALWAVA